MTNVIEIIKNLLNLSPFNVLICREDTAFDR